MPGGCFRCAREPRQQRLLQGGTVRASTNRSCENRPRTNGQFRQPANSEREAPQHRVAMQCTRKQSVVAVAVATGAAAEVATE